MSFQCMLVTPEQQVLDETVQQAIVPAHDGLVGILTGRAPLLVKLGTGELRIDLPGGQKRYFFVDGGIAHSVAHVGLILNRTRSSLNAARLIR